MAKIPRTIFKKEIISEFLPPEHKNKTNKVLILCQGMPSSPFKKEVLELFSKKGFWVFFPRYRGSWESKGKFLKKSPHLDILDIINQLPRGFKNSQTGKILKIKPDKIFVLGSSFGGPAAILASKDKRVGRAVCLAPVIDWTLRKKGNSLEGKFVKEYFTGAYRFDQKDWQKLSRGNFYNPIDEIRSIKGEKIFIIHAKNDKVVPYRPALDFSKLTGSKFKLLPKGEHLGMAFLLENTTVLREVLKFFK